MADFQKLLEQLNNVDTKVSSKALQTLKEMGDGAVQPLLDVLNNTDDWNYRMVAYQHIINFLANTKDPRIIPVFINRLRITESYIYDVAQRAFTAMGDVVVEPLLAVLTGDPEDKANYAAINLAGAIKDPRFIPPLLDKLKSPTPIIRYRAARSLIELQEFSVIPTLQQMAQDTPDRDERRELLRTLDKAGQRTWVIQFASRMMMDDQYSNAERQSMIQVITGFKDPSTADFLMQVLKKQEFGVYHHALQLLTEFKYPPLVDYLIQSLTIPNSNWRGLAAYALGDLGDKRAIQPLKNILRDKEVAWDYDPKGGPQQTVGQVAREALKKLEPPRWKLW